MPGAGTPGPVCLRAVEDVGRAALLAVRVAPHQARFVPDVAATLDEAAAMPEVHLRAVCLANREPPVVVGLLMYALDRDDRAPWIYRLLIDRDHQGKGLGGEALEAAVAELARAYPLRPAVYIGVRPENAEARALYARHGFEPDGRRVDGDIVLRRVVRER
ncbi:acetyltransferase, GNAT family [Caenispirillum salinarum AK4]|uniref:Acetyltransferase, GNAT family n=1 Tax=Caenispirillum salinarum AK4 TaxID=1238182 RepID=K9GXN4_9PROT|nr:GNAT family N-acetyltransferase [Caenispirillum salinarum]EKV30740.1 acetyltransferase, GNAT family [Caenispirillum salinarum AK4]